MYEGRPLARPSEEIQDQGLGFDLGTLLGRRQMLRLFGVGAAAAGLAACGDDDSGGSGGGSGDTQGGSGEIPEETAGPYPGDGSNGPDVLEQTGIVRSDIRTSFGSASGTADGVPMTLELTIQNLAEDNAAFAGVAVYVWHCDREGRYSMYSQGITQENYLRGVQIADKDGTVRFTSIVPACYSGRWPHIHFEVYPGRADIADATKAIATSQVAMPKDTCDVVYATSGYAASVKNLAAVSLASDNVFGDDGAKSQLATVTGDVTNGYTVTLKVRIDTRTSAGGGGQAPGGSDGQPSGAPPSGPGAPGGTRPGNGGFEGPPPSAPR